MVAWGKKNQKKEDSSSVCEIYISAPINKVLSEHRHTRLFLYFCITTAEQSGWDRDPLACEAKNSYSLKPL